MSEKIYLSKLDHEDTKMDKENPTGTGTFSVSRTGTTGTNSFAYMGDASGTSSICIGAGAIATGTNATAISLKSKAYNADCIAIGPNTEAGSSTTAVTNVYGCIAIGSSAKAYGRYSTTIGYGAQNNIQNGIAIGYNSGTMYGSGSGIAIGYQTKTYGTHTLAIGSDALVGTTSSVTGSYSIAIGYSAHAYATNSVVIGTSCNAGYTSESTDNAIVIGNSAGANGQFAISIGHTSSAKSSNDIAIGNGAACNTGGNSIAIGAEATVAANSNFSVAIGKSTKAYGPNCTVIGSYNDQTRTGSQQFVAGNGISTSNESNCLRANNNGVYGKGSFVSSGADYAEMFEWADGNPNNEDRVGLFVKLDGENISLVEDENDFILGIVSAMPSVCGDAASEIWQGKFERDVFGRFIFEDLEVPEETKEVTDPKTGEIQTYIVQKAFTTTWHRQNPNYNPDEEYIPREDRKEWDAVGLLGKLVMIDDGTAEVNDWVKPSTGGIATKADHQTKFRVMARLNDIHIKVLIL